VSTVSIEVFKARAVLVDARWRTVSRNDGHAYVSQICGMVIGTGDDAAADLGSTTSYTR